MSGLILVPSRIRDITPEVLDDQGRLMILPAQYWAGTTVEERALFGHRNGLYSYPTLELVDHLRRLTAGRKTIEIGAGHGVLAQALNIPATDNRMQEKHPYKRIYEQARQPTVPYGPNVEDCHASRAVRKYDPQVVIGCWVTHKYDPTRHWAGGNEIGIDELDILRNCETYILIGNERVHKNKPIWERRHHIEYLPYLYSRAHGDRDFIATWKGSKK